MEEWAAWQDTRALAFLHGRIRHLLGLRGVEDATFDYRGNPVHYYAAGPADAKRTVILLHGLGDSANNWFRTIPLLSWRGDRVIAIDLPGHGYSPPHDERGFLSIREHSALVRALVERKVESERVALVGHSLGGWVATRAHLDGLDATHLALVASAGLVHEGMWDSIEMLRIEHEADVKKFFRIICHRTPFAISVLSKEIAQMFRSPAVAKFLADDRRDDVILDEELEGVRAKTTILWGENDGLIPPIVGHRWHAGVPGSRLVWMPKCGHAPAFERPVLFEKLLEESLGYPPIGDDIRARIQSAVPPALTGWMPDAWRTKLGKA